ncbi:MAG: S1C family serine protease [Planctomycetota bacterium]
MSDTRWLAGLCAVLILAGVARAAAGPARGVSALYEECAPSVVMVTSVETFPAGLANRTGELIRPLPLIRIPVDVLEFVFYPLEAMLRGPRKWGGSGVIIDKEGHLLTNHHVVDGGNIFWAELHDRRLLRAELIGSDEAEDYALLKLDLEGGEVTPARTGDSSKLAVGDRVLAVGSPLRLRQSLAVGVVAGVERRIPKEIGGARGDFQDYVQTDLTIGFGSSGGALFNENAELIGLTTLMVAEGETGGVTFSVPINVVREGIPQLKERGEVIRGYIGAHIKDVTPRLIDELDLTVRSGACIYGVGAPRFRATPAEKAGLRRGDVVIEYKRPDKAIAIDRARTLARAVLNTEPGTEVTLTFVRGEDERTTRLTVEER